MRIDVLTLLPGVFPAYLESSILHKAQEAGLVQVTVNNIRDYATDKHHVTDEPPYGGGGGMILKPEPIFAAVEAIAPGVRQKELDSVPGGSNIPVILLTPQGRLFNQSIAAELADQDHLILICGRYEGVDERVRQHLVTEELSVGDYVLTGGELAAMIVIDAVTRLIPGALGAAGAAERDSHASGLLEGPHYTRPERFRSWSVPQILRSGHAAEIERWRREQALRRTWVRRPDLLLNASINEEDRLFLATLAEEGQIKPSST
jgi:tRNA (guanine37-N1)-methyltransferase